MKTTPEGQLIQFLQQASIQTQLPYDGAYVPTSQDVLVVCTIVMCMTARREEGGEPVYKLVFAPKQKIILTASCAHRGNHLRLIAPIKRGVSPFQQLQPLYEEH